MNRYPLQVSDLLHVFSIYVQQCILNSIKESEEESDDNTNNIILES